MQGGIFGLSPSQSSYLYLSQLLPALIVLLTHQMVAVQWLLILLYATVSVGYIRYLSLQKCSYPYLFNQFSKISQQLRRGFHLCISAFLLISIYGIIFLHLGRLALPKQIHVGWMLETRWGQLAMITGVMVSPAVQEWYWRMYLPKTLSSSSHRSLLLNISYLLLHLALFCRYLSPLTAIPLVGTFFSVGRSMSHIKQKYGFISAVITHYGVMMGGLVVGGYAVWGQGVKLVYQ